MILFTSLHISDITYNSDVVTERHVSPDGMAKRGRKSKGEREMDKEKNIGPPPPMTLLPL